jgi:hypothetical protein
MRIGELPPFRVFVSSPVDGILDFRTEVKNAALAAEFGKKFQFFFYEDFENERLNGKTVCESIFASSGEQFDALFIFFKDRVGSGTIEELDYFEQVIIPKYPNCKIWWSQIYCNAQSDPTRELVQRLLGHSTGLPIVGGDLKIKRPIQLVSRLMAKLLSLDVQILRQLDAQ